MRSHQLGHGFLAAAALAAVVGAGSAGAAVLNRIVATIDGEPITLYELEKFYQEQRAMLGSRGAETREVALQALVTDKLVEKEIADEGIVVRDEDIDRYVAQVRERNSVSDEQMAAALEQQGLTLEQYRENVKREIEKIQLLNREIRGRVNVTPEEVERHYQANRAQYRLPAVVRLHQILLAVPPGASEAEVAARRAEAVALRQRLLAKGTDFAEVAREVSDDPSAEDGGDLGEVEIARVIPEFQAPLRELDPGEVSEPIRTRAGFHLLRVDERIDEHFRPLETVAEEIREELYTKALDDRYRRWLFEDLRSRHHVEIRL